MGERDLLAVSRLRRYDAKVLFCAPHASSLWLRIAGKGKKAEKKGGKSTKQAQADEGSGGQGS